MKKAAFLLAALSLLLAACSQKVDLYFKSDQAWRAEMSLTVDRAVLDLLMQMGGSGLAEELGLPSLSSSTLESETWIALALDMLVQEWQNNGIQARWTQAGNTYTIILSGEGYYQMQDALFGVMTIVQVDDSPEMYQLTGNFGIPDDEFAVLASGLFNYESVVVVHAGDILDCNGCEIRGGVATWYDPASIQVTFTPSNSFSFPWQLLLGALCALGTIVAAAFAVSRASGAKCPECGKRVRRGEVVCGNCGGVVGNFNGYKD